VRTIGNFIKTEGEWKRIAEPLMGINSWITNDSVLTARFKGILSENSGRRIKSGIIAN